MFFVVIIPPLFLNTRCTLYIYHVTFRNTTASVLVGFMSVWCIAHHRWKWSGICTGYYVLDMG
jgi:hypothetical protein